MEPNSNGAPTNPTPPETPMETPPMDPAPPVDQGPSTEELFSKMGEIATSLEEVIALLKGTSGVVEKTKEAEGVGVAEVTSENDKDVAPPVTTKEDGKPVGTVENTVEIDSELKKLRKELAELKKSRGNLAATVEYEPPVDTGAEPPKVEGNNVSQLNPLQKALSGIPVSEQEILKSLQRNV